MAEPARAAARWTLPNPDNTAVEALRQSLSVERVVAAVLVERGYGDPARAREFLSSKLTALEDPFQMRDMEAARARLMRAIEETSRFCSTAITTWMERLRLWC